MRCKANEHFGKLEVIRSDSVETVFRIILPTKDEGMITLQDSMEGARDTPARRVLVYSNPDAEYHSPISLEKIMADPFLTVKIVKTEEDLLDQVAEFAPEYLLFLSSGIDNFESFVNALKGMVVGYPLQVVVMCETGLVPKEGGFRVCSDVSSLEVLLKEPPVLEPS